MPAIITQKFKIRQVESFLTELDNSNVYLFIGNPYPWDDEFNPDPPVDNDGASFSIWDRIYGLVQIPASNYTKCIRRRNWVPDIVYDYYSTVMGPLSEENFYVMTSNFQVYKCLWNNNGALSTIEPTGTAPKFTTDDGYIWTYMYEIGTQDAQTFLTPEYMPVYIVPDVEAQAAGTAGNVTAVRVDQGGSGFLSVDFTGGVLGVGGRPAEIGLNVSGGVVQSAFVIDPGNYETTPNPATPGSIVVTGGAGAGCTLTYTTSGSGIAGVTVTNGGSAYTQPMINKVAYSGSNFTATPVIRGGILRRVRVDTHGTDYTYLSLSVTGGTGAEVTPILSPVLGHGFDAEIELGATNIMFSTTLVPNDVLGYIPPSNRYRDVGIIINPGTSADPAVPFVAPIGTNIIKLTQVAPTAEIFQQNELVTSPESGAQGRVVYWDTTGGVLWLVRTLEENFIPFEVGDTVQGFLKTLTIDSVIQPDVAKYTGEIQYIESREPIQRTAAQFEEIKIVIEF